MPEEETQIEETTEVKTEDAPYDWRSSLPDDIDREDPSLQTIHGTTAEEVHASFAKQHINSQRAIGLDKVVLPGKNASDDEIRQYYTKTGCPETIEGYQTPTEGMSDEFDTDLYESAREEAHRLGMRPDQLAAMARWMDSKQAEVREQTSEATASQILEWEASLEKEHGEAFAQNTALAKAIIDEYGSDELKQLLEDRGLGSHPALFNFVAKIGLALGQDEVLGLGGTHEFDNTPGQATDEWNKMKLDSEFMAAYFDKNHAGHEGAMEQAQKLFKQGAKA